MLLVDKEELIKYLDMISPDDFESVHQYRGFITSLNKKLSSKLMEGSQEIDSNALEEYLRELVKDCFFGLGKASPIPDFIKTKRSSKSLKGAIQEVLSSEGISIELSNDALLRNCLRNILKSSTIAELRASLKLWVSANNKDTKHKDSLLEIDNLENIFSTEKVKDFEIEELKERINELTQALKSYDESTYTAYRVHQLKKAGHGRPYISKELCISDYDVKRYLKDWEFSNQRPLNSK